MPEFSGIPAGSLCSFAAGWEPKAIKARNRFGMGPHHKINCPHCDQPVEYIVSDAPCPYCDELFIGGHDDHIVPRINNGPDDDWNLVLCCTECNIGKNGRSPWEWLGDDWEPPQLFREQFDQAREFMKLPKIEYVQQARDKKTGRFMERSER
jgi:hypothetical protein